MLFPRRFRRAGLALALAALTGVSPVSAAPPAASAPADYRRADIEVFCDLRCPFCARLFSSLYSGAKAERKVPAFKFRHYPFIEGSEDLARFLEAALRSDPAQRDVLLDSLYKFRKQTGIEHAAVTFAALSHLHGLDHRRVSADMNARDTRLAIVTDEREAVQAGVTQTPTVRIRGQVISAAQPEDMARLILDESPVSENASKTPQIEGCGSCSKPRD